eukprot:1161874-Pelagomonas_calceolata.AAC.5
MHATSLAHYTRISNVGAYGPGAGTIRPPVDNSHKGTFPVGSIFYVCQRGDLLGLERIVDKALHVRIPCATCSVKEEVMGLTPLHVASEAGQLEIVEFFQPGMCRGKYNNFAAVLFGSTRLKHDCFIAGAYLVPREQ